MKKFQDSLHLDKNCDSSYPRMEALDHMLI